MSDNTASGDPVDITTEGWPVLHIYYRLDRALWSSLDEKEQEDGIEEFTALLVAGEGEGRAGAAEPRPGGHAGQGEVDPDGDGIGDNADPDIDGDGTPNADDAFPSDLVGHEQFRHRHSSMVAGVGTMVATLSGVKRGRLYEIIRQ